MNSDTTEITESSLDFLRDRTMPLERDDSDITTPESQPLLKLPIDIESIINWKSYSNIYAILSAYGGPTSFLPTSSYIVIGTSKGLILIFNYKEMLTNVLVPELIADKLDTPLDLNNIPTIGSSVSEIVMSYDGTHISAALANSDIYIWDLNLSSSEEPSRVISPLYAILNITDHIGTPINGIAFKPFRHTGIIVSNLKGNISFHNGHRTKLWVLIYSSRSLLKINPDEIIYKTMLEPNTSRSLGLLAVLTNMNFCIISTDPTITDKNILYRDSLAIPQQNTIPNNDIAWFQDSTSTSNITHIAYSVNNQIIAFVFRIISNSFQLIQKKIRWSFTEPILSMTWISKSLLSFITTSHQLIVVNPYQEFKIILKLDLLVHNLLIPPNKFFRFYYNKLLFLTYYSFKVGKFNNWSTLTLKKVQKGDYLGALAQLDEFAKADFPIASLLNLEVDITKRKHQLDDPFINLTFAALRYLLKRPDSEDFDKSLSQLLTFAITIQSSWFPNDKSNVLKLLDQVWDSMQTYSEASISILTNSIHGLIMSHKLNIIPSSIFQVIITKCIHKGEDLQTLLFNLDPECWDVDLLIKTIQKSSTENQIVLPYIWNIKFHDFVTPLVDLLTWIRDKSTNNCELFKASSEAELSPEFIFDYLTYLYLGKYFPSGESITDKVLIETLQQKISFVLFSGVSINWPLDSSNKFVIAKNVNNESSFPYFNLLLNYETKHTLSMLNEIFEDQFFNDSDLIELENESLLRINRQSIIDILIDIIKDKTSEVPRKNFLIAIFLAFNIPKYPQFIQISSKFTDLIIKNLLNSKVQDSDNKIITEQALESLLPFFEPINQEEFILLLTEKKYYGVLIKYYKKFRRYADMLNVALSKRSEEDDGNLEGTIRYIISSNIKLSSPAEFYKIIDILKKNFYQVLSILQYQRTVQYMTELDSDLHSQIMNIPSNEKGERLKQQYLEELSNYPDYDCKDTKLKKAYLKLSCKYKTDESLLVWLRKQSFNELEPETTKSITQTLIASSNYEALSIVHFNLQNYEQVVQDIVICISKWFSSPSKLDDDFDKLMELVNSAIAAANSSNDTDIRQKCWIELLTCLVKQYSNVSPVNHEKSFRVNEILQLVFVKLAFLENEKTDKLKSTPNETKFWKVLAGVLEHQSIILMKIQDINGLLQEIFTTYNLEEQISQLILKILENSSVEIVHEYQESLENGWSVHNNECEVCGKILWGVGLDSKIAHIWEARRKNQDVPEMEIVNGELVIFKCNHGFHTRCLENLGQETGSYACLLCEKTENS